MEIHSSHGVMKHQKFTNVNADADITQEVDPEARPHVSRHHQIHVHDPGAIQQSKSLMN
jgi:hypothetical protein